jgi:hypothetical protein
MRKEVWNWKKPQFELRNIPAEYAKLSKVIIARHVDIGVRRKGGDLILTEIFRESIKLNDKVAVKDYSEFEYTQMERGSGFTAGQIILTYFGLKVIKPGGTIKEVNADDVFITVDDKNQKTAKLAIPDLEVGDIIDYFIARERTEGQSPRETVSAYLFEFYNEVPIMNYSIHSETGKKYAIEYRSYNGAPGLKQTQGPDNINILDWT